MARYFISEITIVVFILINTIALAAMGFVEPQSFAYQWCLNVEYACVLYFIFEAMINITSSILGQPPRGSDCIHLITGTVS